MSVIDDYLAGLSGPGKATVEHMCELVRQMVPDASEELSYAMPAFKYKNKSLVAIIANNKFLSLYPFSSVEKLGVDISAYDHTSGSIHFSPDKPISDDLLRDIISARKQQIDS